MAIEESVRKQLVKIGDPDDCWQWIGSINKRTGYGKKQYKGVTCLAHIWMWEMLFGPIPDGKVINHLCSNRSCVNPHHLEVVNQAENCRHGNGAKLTKEDVIEIKSVVFDLKAGGRKLLAEQYGVTPGLISDIKYGRAWADV